MAKKKPTDDADLFDCPNCGVQMKTGHECEGCDHTDDEPNCGCEYCLDNDPGDQEDEDDDLEPETEDEDRR